MAIRTDKHVVARPTTLGFAAASDREAPKALSAGLIGPPFPPDVVVVRHFGKNQSADYYTFDAAGELVSMERNPASAAHPVDAVPLGPPPGRRVRRPWPRTKPVSRTTLKPEQVELILEELLAAERRRDEERAALPAELPDLAYRERGEAFRRLFKRVELYWDREWRPRLENPDKPNRTDRQVRYRYTLRRELIVWDLATGDMGTSW